MPGSLLRHTRGQPLNKPLKALDNGLEGLGGEVLCLVKDVGDTLEPVKLLLDLGPLQPEGCLLFDGEGSSGGGVLVNVLIHQTRLL